ncbi:MFS transporter [Demequina mangrovi]|uniref:MFS transporter, DHA1 family, inner membrane transport protein n=1 Tax=Demequina mangrovi TaxID=1043493 RepID=A0A1H6U696_9MICO|nr:MFS transporter [Demequina mangrovi]SEI83870.1 MFS transporter, DHA1 family, inner membrane transport protein [Demequina mangrovi]
MTSLSPARTRLALLALALGGFGIGTTEFVAMGLLPDIARDLLPDLYAYDPDAAIARAGIVISAYAIGVVIGAPTIAAVSARYPRKALLTVLAVAFTLGTAASALAPTFETVVAARVLAGLPHGAYFGVAALAAADLMGPGRRGRAVAFVLSGLTIANVVGVPVITWVGQQAGWRLAYLGVAGIFALTTAAIALLVPRSPGDPAATVRRELAAFGRPAVWFALATGALGFGGFFAVYSYVSPLATEVTGTAEGFVPLALIVLGLGMTAGNVVGGRMADAGAMPAVFRLFGAFAGALLLLALTASTVPGLLAGLFLVGATAAAISPAIQTRLMDVAGDSQTIAAAVNHSALNLGNSLGAFLGGAVIAAGWGYLAPTWVGLALCVPGVLAAVAGWAVTRVPTDDAVPSLAAEGDRIAARARS